jgi:excisionase family DNA binding protein
MTLSDLNENVNLTLSKKDLFDLVETCLSKGNRQVKQFPPHLSIKQLSEYLNYSTGAIYKMVSQAEIPTYKLGGGKLLFKKSEIDDWVLDFKQPTTKARLDELNNQCK